jgi:curved DNA-binding protein CbpA
MSQTDYYQVLGLPRDTSPQLIKETYRRLAFQYHPDRNKGDAEAVEKMKTLNEAYAVLSDPQKREKYDNLQHEYGSYAYDRFRQNYSEKDIFRRSDINQIFEEMARNFGFRNFNDVFTEFYGKEYRTFEFSRPGVTGRGFVFFGFPHSRQRQGEIRSQSGFLPGLIGKFTGYLFKKMLGVEQRNPNNDRHDVITVNVEDAIQGAKISYTDRKTSRQLVITIPKGIREGQTIRLKNSENGKEPGGIAGDFYLKVQFRRNLFQKTKELFNKKFAIKH